ncbi:MAG: hypothetical protein U0892_05125 [Pirellulales bacterium]
MIARYDTRPHANPDRIDKKWNNHKHYADHGTSFAFDVVGRRPRARLRSVTVTTTVWDMHAGHQ